MHINYTSVLLHRYYYINVFRIIHWCIVYFAYAIIKWSTIFKRKLYFNIVVLNLIWLLVLYVSRGSLFILNHFLVYYLKNLVIFYIPLLYYYIILTSSRICCLNFGELYLPFDVSLSSPIFSV